MDRKPQTTHTTNDIPTDPTSCITPLGDTNIPKKIYRAIIKNNRFHHFNIKIRGKINPNNPNKQMYFEVIYLIQ